jgi:formate hydrogenlyase subunit 3/multisubunit Na+/H+ antiporter MnhD subunit
MRRHAIGIIALVLLACALALAFVPERGPLAQEMWGACARIGILMVFVWLAYHQLRRIPVWLWYTIPPLLIVVAARPRLIWYLWPLVPVLIVLAMLKPKAKRRKARGGAGRRPPDN